MTEEKANIEFLKITGRAFKIAYFYGNDPKTEYVETLKAYLTVPDVAPEIVYIINQEIEFFDRT